MAINGVLDVALPEATGTSDDKGAFWVCSVYTHRPSGTELLIVVVIYP